MGLVIAFLTLVVGLTKGVVFGVESRLDAIGFALQLLGISIAVIIIFQIIGVILTEIGEFPERIKYEYDPRDNYVNPKNQQNCIGVWVVNDTEYDLTDCWAEIMSVGGRKVHGGNQILSWRDETNSRTLIVPKTRKFLNIAESDDMFLKFLLASFESKIQANISSKNNYYILEVTIAIAIRGKIDNNYKEKFFYGEINYQSVPPSTNKPYQVGNATIYPTYSSTIKLKEIKSWELKQ